MQINNDKFDIEKRINDIERQVNQISKEAI